jgi:hypothetical protein
MTSPGASDHGNPSGTVVLMQKGTALREVEANTNFDEWLILGRRISETLTSTSSAMQQV